MADKQTGHTPSFKLDADQRIRAEYLCELMAGDDLEAYAFELIGLQDSHDKLVEALEAVLNLADKETTWRIDEKWMREGTRYGIYLSADTLELAEAALRAAKGE